MAEPISHILASSSEVRVKKPDGGKASLPNLKEGQIIEARVDRAVDGRQARLLIQGKSFLARTYVPLNAGDTILLKVTQTGTQPRFELLQAKDGGLLFLPKRSFEMLGRPGLSGLLSKIMKHLGRPGQGRQLHEPLHTLVRSLSMGPNPSDPSILSSVIQKSGLTWESKLRNLLADNRSLSAPAARDIINGDLKALMMRIAMNPSKDTEVIIDPARAFTEGIEQLQLLNSHSSQESGKYLLSLPVFWDGAFKFGQILIDLGKEESSGRDQSDRMISVSMLLEMSNLGNVRVDFTLLKDAVNGALGVENAEIKSFVESQLPTLVENLQQNAFTVQHISCRVIEPQILSTTALTDELIRFDEGVLNIVI